MASQSPDTGRNRNQVRPLRSTVSSVRGKANRHRSTGVFGSHFVLDCGGSRKRKGERRICLRHDQSQISARFDGNLTVDPYIRHQWLRDFPKTLDRSGIRSALGRLPIKSSGACVLGCCALRESDRFHSNRINSPDTGYYVQPINTIVQTNERLARSTGGIPMVPPTRNLDYYLITPIPSGDATCEIRSPPLFRRRLASTRHARLVPLQNELRL